MKDSIKISFKQSTIEELEAFSRILNKDIDTILQEALEEYFKSQQERLISKNQNDENAMTNFDFDEFWEDVEI